jgi:Concanavalin A-like lectin/glucanases superfamily/Bacterial Ig-like domain (group 2)/IPT/TIG domain/Glucodextranase, domain B
MRDNFWNGSSQTYSWDSGLAVPLNQWAYVAVTISPANAVATLCSGGSCSSAMNAVANTPHSFDADLLIGDDSVSGRWLKGALDEVRISSIARSADWIATEYNNQNNPSAFYTIQSTSPSITSVSPASGSVGSSVTITGTNFGSSQGSGTATFNGLAAPISGWGPNSITAVVPAGLALGNAVIVVNASGGSSASQSFSVLPSMVSLSLQPAIPGMLVGATQQFSAMGTFSDGSTQNLTAAANWSSYNPGIATVNSNGLVTAVSSGTASITAAVGSASAFVTLNVATAATPPTVTVQAWPPANSNGWNDSNVLVTFTCAAGSSNVVSCPGPQTATTEGTGQVINGTVTDASGGSASASVTLNIEKTLPTITVSYPTDQSSVASSSLTATGIVTNSLTPISGVTCNGAAASLASGSFSCNVGLTSGLNLLSIIAQDTAGNAAGIQLHVTDSNAPPPPISLQITPVAPFVSVGNTQQFTVVDQTGLPRPDATWTVDNASVATISTDSSPILTGGGAGFVTLTASVGSISTQAQLTINPAGTTPTPGSLLWSTPFAQNAEEPQLLPVVPTSGSSIDIVSSTINSANGTLVLQGYSNTGLQLWMNAMNVGSLIEVGGQSMGDAMGGVLVNTTTGYADIDGSTGALTWISNLPQNSFPTTSFRTSGAVGQDGGVYLFNAPPLGPLALMRIAPDSGNGVPIAFLPNTTDSVSSPIVAPDGSIYAGYTTVNSEYSSTGYLWRLAPDGTTSSQLVSRQLTPFVTAFGPGSIIPDGQGGVLAAAATDVGSDFPYYQILDTTSGAVYSFTPQYRDNSGLTMVLGGNGTAYATDGKTIWSFNPLTGAINWSYQPSNAVLSMFASQGGGVFMVDNNDEGFQIDPSGNATDLGSYGGWDNSVASSSGKNWYTLNFNGSSSIVAMAQIAVSTVLDDVSPWPELGGDPENQNQSSVPYFTTFIPKDPGPSFNITQAVASMKAFLKDQNVHANNKYFADSAAVISNFQTALKGETIEGLGFVGDSAVIGLNQNNQTTFYSVGLCFYPQSNPTLNCFVKTPDDNSPNPELQYASLIQTLHPTWQTADSLPVNPKIVFIGSCEISDVFKQWWQIDTSTAGHALVVPSDPSATTNLVSANAEWELIITYVSGKMNVGEAVTKANSVLVNQNSPGSWTVIGDIHVCITTACETSSHTN